MCIEPFKRDPSFSSMLNLLARTQPVHFPLSVIIILSVVIGVGVTRGAVNSSVWFSTTYISRFTVYVIELPKSFKDLI